MLPAATLDQLLDLVGVDSTEHGQACRHPLALRKLRARHELVRPGDPAQSIYIVRSGSFKISHLDEEGYEQVISFVVRGEALGLDALFMPIHPSCITALEDSTVYVLPKPGLVALGQSVPALVQALQRVSCQTLQRSQELVDVLAAVASEVRLARFLLMLSRQMAGCGLSPRRFHLRMGRRDIASLLGVAHETVSRSFTALALHGLVAVDDRDVEILDMAALRAYARCTRRPLDSSSTSPRKRTAMGRAGKLDAAGHRGPLLWV